MTVQGQHDLVCNASNSYLKHMCICKSVANCVISKHLRGTDITFAETSSLSLATAEQGAEPLTGGILIVC